MESEMLQSSLLGLGEEDEADLMDWNLPLAFMKKRHCEKIESFKSLAQSWRKDRKGLTWEGRPVLSVGGTNLWAGFPDKTKQAAEHWLVSLLSEDAVELAPPASMMDCTLKLSHSEPPFLQFLKCFVRAARTGTDTEEESREHELGLVSNGAGSWMKTVRVALVLCLNVGVDPPDVVKTTPCARLECWIDPLSMGPQKALETIGASLQKQYENWQPRTNATLRP